MDLISGLPDSLLYHILSFLPTKIAVATCLVSRRWRYLWQHLQVFDFEQDTNEDYTEELFGRFAVFVNGVLARRKARDIRKFCLSCYYPNEDSFNQHSVTNWVLAAVGPHLQELVLFLAADNSSFHLPYSVLTCTSLVSLTLDGGITIADPPSVSLPALKTLIMGVDHVTPINKVFSGCPVLETLHLYFHVGNAPKICLPSSLKTLTFDDRTDLAIEEFEMSTPALEILSITINPRCYNFTVNNLSNVDQAHLSFFSKFCEVDGHVGFILMLLKALYKTPNLFFNDSINKCLLRAPALDFPNFSCLHHLIIELPYFNSSFMINLLHKCPMLLILRIFDKQGTPEQTSYPSGWTHPTSVPSCLVSHLAIVEFSGGYQGSRDEQEFTKYILHSGLALESVTIHSSLGLLENDLIVMELCGSPKGSNTCKVKIVTD